MVGLVVAVRARAVGVVSEKAVERGRGRGRTPSWKGVVREASKRFPVVYKIRIFFTIQA